MIMGAGMKVKLPYAPREELFAIVMEISGGSRMKAFCEDDKTRMVRIPGRLKKKMWCRVNDIIIIKKWAVQSDKKCDLVYRFRPIEREVLKRKGLLPKKLIL
jgi:translation initiation factor 1A